MKSAKSSVCQLLWSEQKIFHLRVSLVILCCFIRCGSIYPRCLEKLRKSITDVTVSCLLVTVRGNLLTWQWLESFFKVVRTLCPTKRIKGRFLSHVFNDIDSFLNAFAKLRKATSFVVCPSFHPHGKTRLPLEGFSCNLSIFRKSIEKIQVSVRPGKNNGYCIWRPMHVYDSILLGYSSNEMFQSEVVEKIKTRFLFSNLFFWKLSGFFF